MSVASTRRHRAQGPCANVPALLAGPRPRRLLSKLHEAIVAELHFPAVGLAVVVEAAVLAMTVPPQRPDVLDEPRLGGGGGRYVGE